MWKRFSVLVLTCLATTQVSGRWCELFDPAVQSTNPLLWTKDPSHQSKKEDLPKANPLAKAMQLPDNAGSVKIVQLPLSR